jgi:hypothetical protein
MNQSSLFLKKIYSEVNFRNRNFICICVGPTGSGKSWSMLDMCETLDKTFTAARVVFSIEQFQDLLRSKRLTKGSFIMWDEGGAGISSRESLRQGNIWAVKVAQTMRNRNYGVCITVPSLGMIDKQIRQLAHYLMEPITYNTQTGISYLDLKKLQNNVQMDRVYCYPPTITVDGEKVIVDTIKLHRPSDTLVEEYERRKAEFQEKLYDGDQEALFRKLSNMNDKYRHVTEKGKIKIDKDLLKNDYPALSDSQIIRIKKRLEVELNG